jgi:hypothetical protein
MHVTISGFGNSRSGRQRERSTWRERRTDKGNCDKQRYDTLLVHLAQSLYGIGRPTAMLPRTFVLSSRGAVPMRLSVVPRRGATRRCQLFVKPESNGEADDSSDRLAILPRGDEVGALKRLLCLTIKLLPTAREKLDV